jgi:hypothetical protein
LLHQPRELTDQLVVAPERQIRLDALLDRTETELLEPRSTSSPAA